MLFIMVSIADACDFWRTSGGAVPASGMGVQRLADLAQRPQPRLTSWTPYGTSALGWRAPAPCAAWRSSRLRLPPETAARCRCCGQHEAVPAQESAVCLPAGLFPKLCLHRCLLLLWRLLSGYSDLLRLLLCCLEPSCRCLYVLIHCEHLCSMPLCCLRMGRLQQQQCSLLISWFGLGRRFPCQPGSCAWQHAHCAA